MHVHGKLFVPLITLFLYASQKVTAKDDGDYEVVMKSMEEKVEDVEDKTLRCYRCYEFEEDCQTLANVSKIEISECDMDETFCQVRRLDNRDVLQTFERGCTRECTPGCQTMLYRTLCVTCCNTSLCNTDTATGVPVYTGIVWLVAGVLTMIFSGYGVSFIMHV